MSYLRIVFLLVIIGTPNLLRADIDNNHKKDLREAVKNLSIKTATNEQRRLAAVANIAMGEYGKAYFALKKIPEDKRDIFIKALLYEIYSKLEMAPEASAQLKEIAAESLKDKKLAINKMLFCRKIMGYGMYNPFATNHFEPGQLVLVYSEIDNFTKVKVKGSWEIDLKVGIVISSDLGMPLYRNDNFSAVQFSPKSPTRDLWLTSRINIPKTVKSGKKYKLLITVTDTASGFVVSKDIPFIGA